MQYVEIDSYLKDFTVSNQNEYLSNLTESEKVLTTYYKRVVEGGKGSRAIIIFFPHNIQNFINQLLEIRNEISVISIKNKYLFTYPDVNDQCVKRSCSKRIFQSS